MRKNCTFNTNWVSVRNGAPHVIGFVNGSQCKIVPDTGAEISIVPGCLVYGDQLTGEQVDVKGWDGRPVTLDTAIVDFMFKGRTFSSKVVIAHEDSLCGCVLFSVPMETARIKRLGVRLTNMHILIMQLSPSQHSRLTSSHYSNVHCLFLGSGRSRGGRRGLLHNTTRAGIHLSGWLDATGAT